MANEIIYKCNSLNNKNVREGELNILRKFEKELYFEFGEDETNIKKRFYNNIDTLNKDFEALEKLKSKEKVIEKSEEELNKKITKENVVAEIPVEEVELLEEPEEEKKSYRKFGKK